MCGEGKRGIGTGEDGGEGEGGETDGEAGDEMALEEEEGGGVAGECGGEGGEWEGVELGEVVEVHEVEKGCGRGRGGWSGFLRRL